MSTIVLILSLITWIVLVLVYKEFKMADIILGTVGVLIFSIVSSNKLLNSANDWYYCNSLCKCVAFKCDTTLIFSLGI